MNCPKCQGLSTPSTLEKFGGLCPKCLLHFAGEKDAPDFPNLEIVSMLGEGGMGVVYKATQTHLSRTVALKILSPRLGAEPSFGDRFIREAQALAQMNHPNIVALYDSGIHDGVPYLIMEYVEGRSLRSELSGGAIAPARAVQIVGQVCDALQYARTRGVVHRDIKPENILIDPEGRVKIADFGLAKIASADRSRLTQTNALMGTPQYMAPEQIENPASVDHRADLYSLGVVLYEMLTGELPLGRFRPPSEKASVHSRLDPIVLRLLEKEPDRRPSSAEEVKELLQKKSSPPSLSEPGDRPRRKSGAGASVLGLISFGLAILIAILHLSMVIVTDGNWNYFHILLLHHLGYGGFKSYQVGTFLLFVSSVVCGVISGGMIRRERIPGKSWAPVSGILLATVLLGIPMTGILLQVAVILLPVGFVSVGCGLGAILRIREKGFSQLAWFSGVDFLSFLATGAALLIVGAQAETNEAKILRAASLILGILMNGYALATLVQVARIPRLRGRWVAFAVLASSVTLATLGAIIRLPAAQS